MNLWKIGSLMALAMLVACSLPFINADAPTPTASAPERKPVAPVGQPTQVSIPTSVSTRQTLVPGGTATSAAITPTPPATVASTPSSNSAIPTNALPSVVGPVSCGTRAQTSGMLIIEIKNWFDAPLSFTVDLMSSVSIPAKPFNTTNIPYCFEIRPGSHKWKVSIRHQTLEGNAEVPTSGKFGLSFCPTKEDQPGYITTEGCGSRCLGCPPGDDNGGGH